MANSVTTEGMVTRPIDGAVPCRASTPGCVGPAPDLGVALRSRAAEVGDRLLEMWRDGAFGETSHLDPGEWAVVESCIRETARAGTLAVADFLVTGEIVTRDRSEQWDWSGEVPLSGLVTLSGLTRLYLEWRRICAGLVREESAACGARDEERDIALGVVRIGSDASLVRMAKRFESTRKTLEDQLAENQARLEHQALHDPLTGLANRVLLLDRLEHALQSSIRRPGGLAVLFLDLDYFKSVNDVSGHSAGDELLFEVGARLQSVVRPNDTIARLGGDEFVVVAEDLADPVEEGAAVAARISSSLQAPFRLAGREVFVAASVGVAPADPSDSAEALLARADQAMYRAKQLGRRRVELYDPVIDRQATRHALLSDALHRALGAGELRLAYQPIVTIPAKATIAREALLRWDHPTLGDVEPTEFVPIAERTGLIVELGAWVLRHAVEDCARWRAEGERDVGVAVNVSGIQLDWPRFPGDVEDLLRSSALPGEALTLEVTETQLMADGAVARASLERLRTLGVRVAIDDFGTGYSSLSWLAHLPLDILKVDRSFVAALCLVERDAVVVEAMVRLAHTLGLGVVAEGVETEMQLARLVALGCDGAQGFLIGRPAPIERASVTWDRVVAEAAAR
jgi:diguanylate cyclase (GGDEF)-like protein